MKTNITKRPRTVSGKTNTAGSAVTCSTTAPATIPDRVAIQRDPEFLRLPRTGSLCPFTGLTRSKLNELCLPNKLNGFKPPVKSVCLRQRGAVKGIRLIVFQSLMDYLHGQEGRAAA
jgi:hypothetical protein